LLGLGQFIPAVMADKEMSRESVKIHGEMWKYEDVREAIEQVRNRKWTRQKWKPRAALVSRGKVTDYWGQKYDPQCTQLVEDGWTHDHCEICWWTLSDSDEPEQGEGYTTDGHSWICEECFFQFINDEA